MSSKTPTTEELGIHASNSQTSLDHPGKPDIANGEVVHSASGHLDAVYGIGGVGHTQRRLKARHVTFIGIGGGIGTGLFIGTGAALANAGPLGLLLAYTITGLILWCVMESIGELATLFPTAGSFSPFRYSIRLIIVSVVITAGGAPNHESIGFRYWKDPGPFVPYEGITGSAGNFLAFFSAFINASWSYIGVETVVVAAAETINPHKSIPKAVKRVTYRILFFYVLGTLLIGMIVSSSDPGLVSDTGNANSSPWVIAIKNSGISALPSIINACILTSAWSAGNSYCYVGARMIVAMAVDRQAPQVFAKCNRWGVPYWAVVVSFAFGPLAYLSLGSGGPAQAFQWLLNLSTDAANHMLHMLVAIGSAIIVIFSGFGVFIKGNWSTANFIASYIGIVIYVAPYIFWKIFKKTKITRSKEMDLFSGRFDSGNAPVEPIPTTAWGKFLDWLI
ncbi:hypothetical protein DID88_006973 [Monilinia fructigena]|uniref:Amino acid permease/ SLC12A domain-containing protein n=1 Tax=Monilinia fructigena TaxID=38457 RepID=A0A395ILK1_9HELO|nr:hypothetical protein DID88_006973 [Monilinia fructigena]